MTSEISRRDFLAATGGTAGLIATAGLAKTNPGVDSLPIDDRPKWTKETYTICPNDASGCGFICYTDDQGRLVNI